MDDSYDVLVIGGGASGMMAAISAAEAGAKVLLIEKNKRLGEKLRISGGGRCNILHAQPDVRALLGHYGDAAKYLFSAFHNFGMQESWNFFETNKLPLKIEANNRAFPASEKAVDVVHTLHNKLHRRGVTLNTSCTVEHLVFHDNASITVQTSKGDFKTRTVILATGGTSRPETGSTGDGFLWLQQFGHTIKQPTPNITPLILSSSWKEVAAGKTVNDCAVSFVQNSKQLHKVKGSVVFTHFGVSGPVILNSAQYLASYLQNKHIDVFFDLRPDITHDELDALTIAALNAHGTKLLKNTISQLVPEGFSAVIKHVLSEKYDISCKNSEVSKTLRHALVSAIKSLPATATGLMGFDKAVVADGGVPLQEINMRTMQSVKISNLFITGDLLHIKRPSGGFSLQLCWTTGYVAGKNAAMHALTYQ